MIEALVRVADRLIQLREYQDRRAKDLHKEVLKPAYDELLQVHKDYLRMFQQVEQMLPSMDFLSSPAVSWKGDYNFVMFDSSLDAERFAEAENKDRSAIFRIIRRRSYALRLTPAGGTTASMQLYFEFLHDAMQFSNQRGLGSASPLQVPPPPPLEPDSWTKIMEAATFVRQARLEFAPVRAKIKALSRALSGVKLNEAVSTYVTAILDYFPDGSFDTKQMSSGATQVLSALQNISDQRASIVDPFVFNDKVAEVQSVLWTLSYDYDRKWERVSELYAGLMAGLVARR
ncbi:hypothetical protein QTI66_36705 [Variovorax sp. J22R133]|uniref:hypothetical protein n=1 Tax=Variovorax brevis TaxID=3053503 RepID=UPI002577C37C|nr:hypothetical protein [Variovorax sp. J22R133]MDM0117648.1 hypothetical protein [Variovorax sp. J22R133]